jgi:Nitrate and nitrite sensing
VAGLALAAVHELQEERVRAVAWAAGQGRDGEAELSARRRRVDRALAAYRAGSAGLGATSDPALDRALTTAATRLDWLAVQRAPVDRRLVPPERPGIDHDTMIAALLGVARGLADRLTAREPARVARFLLAATEAKEATGQERTLLAAGPPGPATVPLAAAAAWLARSSATSGPPPATTWSGSTAPSVSPGSGRSVRSSWPWCSRPSARRPSAIWRRGGPGWPTGRRRCGGSRRSWPATWRRRPGAGSGAGSGACASGWPWWPWSSLSPDRGPRPAQGLGPPGDGAARGGLGHGARRAKELTDRQLRLLEELTLDEPDPRRRQGLAGVGHLTTRLRRAAMTLLATTWPGPAGDLARPAPVATLLRAAVAETEAGLGMTGRELAWANQRLAGDAAPGVTGQDGDDRLGRPAVAQMGHGFAVRLDPPGRRHRHRAPSRDGHPGPRPSPRPAGQITAGALTGVVPPLGRGQGGT